MAETTFNPNDPKLHNTLEQIRTKAAELLQKGEGANIFEAIQNAAEEVLCESTGRKTIWEAGESERVQMVEEFNDWFLKRWAELRKEVGQVEHHCNYLLPFATGGSSQITDREFECSAGKYFKLRAEFNLFDDYYYDAVSGVMDFALEMSNPAAAHLWGMFIQAKWNEEVKG